jgi:hypothetical protein
LYLNLYYYCVLKNSLRRKEVKLKFEIEKEKEKKVVLELHLLQFNSNHTYVVKNQTRRLLRGLGCSANTFKISITSLFFSSVFQLISQPDLSLFFLLLNFLFLRLVNPFASTHIHIFIFCFLITHFYFFFLTCFHNVLDEFKFKIQNFKVQPYIYFLFLFWENEKYFIN